MESSVFSCKLPLDTAGTVAACQLFHFSNCNHIVVALDGVLLGRSSNCKFNSCLGILAGEDGVDQTAAKAVAAANAVDDVQVVLLREAVLVLGNIVEHCAPAVVKCGVAFPQGDSDHLEV